jgi:hypothetical protein
MSKERPAIGANGLPLPILPPERDVRVWAKLTRVVVYTPGFLALLLLKVGEPTGFGITVELLMLASTAAIVAGLFIGTQSNEAGADHSSRVAAWSGGLVLELLCAVPILCAVPGLFHELANSKLLHSAAPGAVAVPLGITELLPAVAILPFMLYQLAGFGTLHYVVSKPVNWMLEPRHPRSDPGQHRRQPHGRVRCGKGTGRHAGHRHGAGGVLWRDETAPDADRI